MREQSEVTLPAEPGSYRLWLQLDKPAMVRVGSLGKFHLPAGRYVYAGCARGGLRGRVVRYLGTPSKFRWHVDYLLPHMQLLHVELFRPPRADCELAEEVLRFPGAERPIRGFGSSDCRCAGHLVGLPAWMPVPTVSWTNLPGGEPLCVRLLRADDTERLAAYFDSLGPVSRSRYGPHAFDHATAVSICGSLDPRVMMRIVGCLGEGPSERIIAYMLVHRGVRESDGRRYAELGIPLAPEQTGALAPSVADAYQGRGVGSAVMARLLDMVRSVGVRRLVLWDGVIADNDRARAFYTKWGFRKVGEFRTSCLNHDMMLDLDEPTVPVISMAECR